MTNAVQDPRLKLAEAARLRGLADAQEKDAITIALRLVGGNVRQAADLLGIKHRTLDKRLREGRYLDLFKQTARKQGRPSSK